MKCNRKSAGIVTAAILFTACVAVALLIVFVATDRSIAPRAATKTGGVIVGRTVTLKDGKTQIHEFHNIRYAEAPVGSLKFRPPKAHVVADTSEVVEATDDTVVKCIQTDTGEGSEDCLFLTVRSANLTASKPVIMWIHGGGLFRGYGADKGYSFDSNITDKVDAVTVNINYRLGFIGFSSVEELWDVDAGVYANNGIRDMIAALDWIQANIAAFGGDPKSVTVIGESGGATAVLALTCSPLANNKFHAGISQSPAPEMRLTHVEGNTYQRTFVDQAGCTQATLEERKQCLLDFPAYLFTTSNFKLENGKGYFLFPMMISQTAEVGGFIMIDPTVVTVSPRNLKDATFTPASPLPVVISNTDQENYFYTLHLMALGKLSAETAEGAMTVLFKQLTQQDNTYATVKELYPDITDPISLWNLITCDMRSTCPSNDVATAMASSANHRIYRLYITHILSLGIPAHHNYDSLAFFGYKQDSDWLTTINEVDVKFQMHYTAMVKKLATDKSFGDAWGTFPSKSMVYEYSDEISSVVSEKPQQSVCVKLTELDLVKYGWQNK